MTETKIYVGLNDSETRKQEFATGKYASILKTVCVNYHVSFSFFIAQGGYIHEDGGFTQENTLVLSLIDADSKVVDAISRDLCAFFNQESVLITENEVKAYFVNERI